MPQTASIQIVVDEKGALQAFDRTDAARKKLEAGLKNTGDSAGTAFDQVGKRTERARDAVQLLSNVVGIQVPRSLEKVIAKAPGVGTALSAAFGTAALVAFGAQIVRLVSNIDDFRVSAVKAVDTFHIAIDQVKELFGGETSPELGLQRYQKQLVILGPLLQQMASLQREADSVGLEGLDAIEQKRLQDRQDIEKTYHASVDAAKAAFGETSFFVTALSNLKAAKRQADVEADRDAAAKRVAYEKQVADQTLQLNIATALARQEITQSTGIIALGPLLDLAAKAANDSAKGIEAMNIQLKQTAGRQQELAQRSIQASRDIKQAEEDASIAILPPWERANAQIVLDFHRRKEEIAKEFQGIDADGSLAARAVTAEWTQAFARMRDNLADQLQGLFDDITSGNIGKRFLDNFKKLVFQMIASWALGLRQMQTQTAGTFSGGGLLGTLLGIGGIGGFGGSGAQQVGPGGTAGILSGLFGGGSGGGILGALFGGGSSASASTGLANLPTALSSSQLGNLGLTALPLSAGGGIGGGTVLPAGATAALGGKFAGLLAAGPGLALLGAGGLFGLAGKAGPIGGAALGTLGGLLGTGGLIAAFPALLGVLGAATLGIGALIGGIIGLFGGLFGNSKRQRAVEQLGQQVKDQITQVENAYNTHQEDAGSAISQLEQLRQTAHAQMHKLGGDTRTRVEQPVDAAESYINQTEAERLRRAAIQFGPAQFRHGGFVGAGLAGAYPAAFGAGALHYATGGAVPAILHSGEFVLKPEAVQRVGVGTLNAVNSGSAWGGEMHFHAPLVQAERVDEAWLRNGGAVKIAQAINRAVREGRI